MYSIINEQIFHYIGLLANLATLVVLIVAIIQLCANKKTQKINNSIEILSWFDKDDMQSLLENIEQNNKNAIPIPNEEKILDLLYYLDTVCALVKNRGVNKKLFYQMNHDFKQISINSTIQAKFEIYQNRLPDLEFEYLLDQTTPPPLKKP